MISERVFDISIDTVRPIVFMMNKDKNIKKHLAENIVGSCYMGCKIIEIKDILQVSKCYIINSNNNAYGTINVSFSCNVATYHDGMVIPAAIAMIENGCYMAKHETLTIALNNNEQHKMIQSGMKMPVKLLDEQRYDAGASIIVSSGTVFTSLQNHEIIYYSVNGKLSQSECASLQELYTKVMEIKVDKSHFLYPLYYHYKKEQKMNNIINIIDYIVPDKHYEGVWVQHNKLHQEEPIFAEVEVGDNITINTTVMKTLTSFLMNTLSFRKALSELSTIYKTESEHPQLIEMLIATQSP